MANRFEIHEMGIIYVKKGWYSQEIILYLNLGSNFRLLGFEDLKLKFWKDCPHPISLTSKFVLRLPPRKFLVREFKSFCITQGTPLLASHNAACSALVCTAAVMQLSFPGWLLSNISSAWKCNDATLFYRLPEIFCRKARLDFFSYSFYHRARTSENTLIGGCYKTPLPQENTPRTESVKALQRLALVINHFPDVSQIKLYCI